MQAGLAEIVLPFSGFKYLGKRSFLMVLSLRSKWAASKTVQKTAMDYPLVLFTARSLKGISKQ